MATHGGFVLLKMGARSGHPTLFCVTRIWLKARYLVTALNIVRLYQTILSRAMELYR